MLKRFYPYNYVKDVFIIDYKKLYEQGYRGLIFDIDNTLVHHGDDSNIQIDNLFQKIQHIGFKTFILSNNSKERVERFLTNIDALYICNAQKPKKYNYLKALKMMNLDKKEVIFVGDQLFTDILGANRCNIPSILVEFININPNADIGKRRKLEKNVLNFYKKNKKYYNRLGNIKRK